MMFSSHLEYGKYHCQSIKGSHVSDSIYRKSNHNCWSSNNYIHIWESDFQNVYIWTKRKNPYINILPKFLTIWKLYNEVFITKIKGKPKGLQAKPPKFRACGGLKNQKSSLIKPFSTRSNMVIDFRCKIAAKRRKFFWALFRREAAKISRNQKGLYMEKSRKKTLS